MSAPPDDTATPVDPVQAAESVGLRYVNDTGRGIRREREGEGWRYLKPGGGAVEDEATLARVRKLAIPPAWTDVWICPQANGHLQATGRDARGRKQYRYHPQFREVRESTKYEHMLAFAQSLPTIRARVAAHMRLRGLPREKVLATVVHLLETTLIRVGNDDYARENKSYGLTTLRDRHVQVDGGELRFRFTGKSGKAWQLQVKDRRVANIVRACQELPGQELFQYQDEAGELKVVSSSDVNDYLREVSGRDITAKDFRTWTGTVLAALALQEFTAFDTQAAAKRHLRTAIEQVAGRLGNTPTICRKCYIHPEVISAFGAGELALEIENELQDEVESELKDDLARLRPEEAAVLSLLQARLARTARGQLQDSLVQARRRRKRPAIRESSSKKSRQPSPALHR